MKAGIIGCGRIAQIRHIPEYAENEAVQIAGYFDMNQERAAMLAQKYGGKVYGDVDELLADPEIDAVSVCVANNAHADISIQALNAGKHVLCEKPMAVTLEECIKMVETAKEKGKYLMIGQNQRFAKVHIRAKELLAQGEIGKVLSFKTTFGHGGPETWSVDAGKNNWFFDKKRAAFIVTLATMLIFRSFAQYFCQRIDKKLLGGGSSVYRMAREASAYQPMYDFGNGRIATMPIVGIILILLTVIFVYITTSTKYGKKIYAVGSNVKGAAMSGINVSLMKVSVFVIAGILVGISAFLWIAMNASADPATTGNSYEMYAIAAVVLGGISMSGGKGKCIGILFGSMSYDSIDKIIVALKMDSLINDAIKGIILLLVIMIQLVGPQIKERLSKHKN